MGGNTRGGSTPLSRMRKPPLPGGFHLFGTEQTEPANLAHAPVHAPVPRESRTIIRTPVYARQGMHYLSLTDLFLIGLALDITGAWLLAKGLLISPASISKISATLWGGNPETARDRCANRVDAEFGVAYLAGGFFLQAIGYSLEIGGVGTETGTGRLLAALAMALLTALVALAAYFYFHRGRVARLISETEQADAKRTEAHDREQEAARKVREAEAAGQAADRRAAGHV